MWQELTDTLDKLGEIYDTLAQLGERKRSALVGVDMSGLSKILDEEQLLIAKLQKLEKRRVELLAGLSQSNTTTEATRAEEFYRLAPPDTTKQLLAAHERLSKNVARAVKIRDNNRVLAQCALDAVQNQLNRLSGATIEPTYSDKGAGIVSHQKKYDFRA